MNRIECGSARESALELRVASHGEERLLAMRVLRGAAPAIVWLGGFRSDLTSTKAEALVEAARDLGRAALRFDYTGHGTSGGAFEDGSISIWLEDAIAAIRAHGGAAPVVVGSSMGGWIALLAALRLRAEGAPGFPSRLVLIAPAVDFTEELIWANMSPVIRAEVMEKGLWMRESQYGPPYPITRKLIEDGRGHLLFGKLFEIGCRIDILQGVADPDVPVAHVLRLVEHLPKDEVRLTTIPDGDHRLSRPEDIAFLKRIVFDGTA
jgi:pimeloyl-ACP methyl ester carboxylesterase